MSEMSDGNIILMTLIIVGNICVIVSAIAKYIDSKSNVNANKVQKFDLEYIKTLKEVLHARDLTDSQIRQELEGIALHRWEKGGLLKHRQYVFNCVEEDGVYTFKLQYTDEQKE